MKNRFHTTLFVLLSIFISSALLSATDIIDPTDMIYDDLEFWQEQGYYRHIPELRPYSSQLIISLLEQVMEKGNVRDVRIAADYYNEINRSLRLELNMALDTRLGGQETVGETYGTLDFYIRGMLTDELSLWGNVSANGVLNREEPDYFLYNASVPYGYRTITNTKEDSGTVAGIDLMGGSSSMLSYGTPTLHTNMGLYQSSFGPFQDDGIVISSQAHQQSHYELTWYMDDFSYTMLFLGLIGSNNRGDKEFAEKFMAMHSYNWAPLDWLDIGFFETVVYGERFEPVYLLPFNYLFNSQGYVGFADNSLMGLKLRSLLPGKVEVNGMVYVDDVNFNQLVKFDFNTKMKIAFETGASWSPGESWLHKINCDYTAVMPYMYTHYDWHEPYATEGGDAGFNVDNYSHYGENLGTTLSPNSDRIAFSSNWRLGDKTDVTLFGNWMRHGNASSKLYEYFLDGVLGDDGFPLFDEITADGSLFDNGIDDDGELYFQDTLPFLTQDVLEKVLQLGFDFTTTIDMPYQDVKRYYGMEMGIGYTFEQIWNSARESDYGFTPVRGDNEVNHYVHFTMRVFF